MTPVVSLELACTPAELARLQTAFRGSGLDHAVVAGLVKRADAAIAKPVKFPPRGGQHNQWYQCDRCQIALKTLDETHHQCPICKKIYSGPPQEGMWYENSWGYHFYALQPLVAVAEACRRLGVNVWNPPRLKAMFTLPVSYTMADGALPRFGDDTGTSVRQFPALMESAYQAYQDPLILALLPSRPSWDTVLRGRDVSRSAILPPSTSAVFPGTGHAILRTGGDLGMTAALTFSPYGGYHGHLDKLSLVLFANQQELVVDPGCARSQAYRLPIHRHWYKATLSHNTVVVDQRSQKPTSGKLELFADNGLFAAVLVACDSAYPGVRHRRLLVMSPEYLLVVDDLNARSERRFDWMVHHRGSPARSETPGTAVDFSGASGGYEYVQHAASFRTSDPVAVWFEERRVVTCLTAASAGDTEVILGDGPGASIEERIPLAILSRRGRAAQFVVVLEPVLKGQEAEVVQVASERLTNGDVRIILQRQGPADTVVLTADRRLTVKRGEETVLTNP